MALPKLTRVELRIMDAVWRVGPASVREIQEALPAKKRPAYTTVQTMVYRLEAKGAVARVKKIGNAHCSGGNFARIHTAPAHRRAAELLRRKNPAGDGAPRRIRPSVARRRQSREDARKLSRKDGTK